MKIKAISILIMMTVMKKIKGMTEKMNYEKNFMNSIESGFNSMNNNKVNLSMNFTYIMIIFVLFDIEMMILVPMILTQKKKNFSASMITMFLMFMVTTTMAEMKNNKIKWMT